MDKVCKQCGKPLSGKQRSYCSQLCQGRYYRRQNKRESRQVRLTHSDYAANRIKFDTVGVLIFLTGAPENRIHRVCQRALLSSL